MLWFSKVTLHLGRVLPAHGILMQAKLSILNKEKSAVSFKTPSPELLRLPGWRRGSGVSQVHAISAIIIFRITGPVKQMKIAFAQSPGITGVSCAYLTTGIHLDRPGGGPMLGENSEGPYKLLILRIKWIWPSLLVTPTFITYVKILYRINSTVGFREWELDGNGHILGASLGLKVAAQIKRCCTSSYWMGIHISLIRCIPKSEW